MMHLDQYPAAIQSAIRQFAPASWRWAIAAGVGLDDVHQEIAAAVLSGQNPAAVVPAALGLRRLTTGWCSKDLEVAAGLADCIVDESTEIASEQSEPLVDGTGLAAALIGGTEAVANRSRIGRRAAQMRVKEQLRRFEMGGDLFAPQPQACRAKANGDLFLGAA